MFPPAPSIRQCLVASRRSLAATGPSSPWRDWAAPPSPPPWRGRAGPHCGRAGSTGQCWPARCCPGTSSAASVLQPRPRTWARTLVWLVAGRTHRLNESLTRAVRTDSERAGSSCWVCRRDIWTRIEWRTCSPFTALCTARRPATPVVTAMLITHHFLHLLVAETVEECGEESLEACEEGGCDRPEGEIGDVRLQ